MGATLVKDTTSSQLVLVPLRPDSCVAICTPVMAAADSSLRAVSDMENQMPNAWNLGTSWNLGTAASVCIRQLN